MEREPYDKKLEQWLDDALKEIGNTEPRPGIEARVLQNLRSRVQRRTSRFHQRWALWLTAATATIAIFALLVFTGREKPPAPELQHRSDQELLLGVDRLLDQKVPAALEPALVLTQEIAKSKK